MPRSDRLYQLLDLLQDKALHRAEDLAHQFGVSERTIYRDMATLIASGLPIKGARGVGYRMADLVPLPALLLTQDELEVLHLGLSIASELGDPDLRRASDSLSAKIDAVLPEAAEPDANRWQLATYPFGDTARGLSHLPVLRAAIKARQKLRLTYTTPEERVTSQTVHPLALRYLGRFWILNGNNEQADTKQDYRLDLIDTLEPLPELFSIP